MRHQLLLAASLLIASAPLAAQTPEAVAAAALKAAPVWDGHNDVPEQLRDRRKNVLGDFNFADTSNTADPAKDPQATRYENITFDEAIARNLQVMDATAFALCRDQKLPIKVFSIFKPGALERVVRGENEGPLLHV